MKKHESTNEMFQEERKPYSSPQIIHEMELETRAGSPLGFPDDFDLPGGK